MKQLLTLVPVIALMGAPAAYAQPQGVGVKIGVNVADLSTDEQGFNPKTRTGVVAGVFATVPINNVVSFQPEVLYSQQGAKIEDGSDKATIELDYVQIPLLARINVAKASPVGILVGPSIGFRSRARVKGGGETADIKDEVEGTDFGLVTGIAVNAGRAVFDARYTWGLRNIDKTLEPDNANIKNRVFSASVGVRF